MSTLLPAKWAATPTGQAVAGRLTSLTTRNRTLAAEAKQALSPAALTGYTQLGAAAAGAVAAYGGERAPQFQLGLAVLGLAFGSVQERPEVVAAANGMLAVLTAAKAFEALTAGRKPAAQKQPTS